MLPKVCTRLPQCWASVFATLKKGNGGRWEYAICHCRMRGDTWLCQRVNGQPRASLAATQPRIK